ncbi:MAG TPA: glutamyl-tRNA reductase [Candidatus Angelobacter sp.]|nr:MAG: glutamyl-tRNA reductase [Candidatus Angelobacter sp. Gp1-AA117]HMC29697.1 glutamyl-tRNA reductase [Candidatus Angelobacter sp.]
MNFQLIGVNHNSAPLDVRERLAIPEAQLPDAIRTLVQQPGVDEGMVLSTCNRVEVLTSTRQGSDLREFLCSYFGVSPDALHSHIYEFQQRDAVRHVFRVASSLDSMVVGEPQILGQVKEAYAIARGMGAVHSALEALLSRAFAVAKRIRTETAIGSSSVSISAVAVQLAQKIFGSLSDKTVYVVGAGKMAELAARHLIGNGVGTIFFSNRTHERAVQLAEAFGGQAIPFDQLHDTVNRADIVLTSTGATEPLFRREHGERLLSKRRNRPMFFIDIAVPRNVDPEMNRLDGMFVYDVDDLQAVASSNSAERKKEAERAEQIIELEVERFATRMKSLAVVPTILSLQEQCETIRQAEIDRIRGKLGKLTPEQEAAIEAMTRGIVNKLLHTPITTLKSTAAGPEAATIHDIIRRIFNLNKS